MKVRLVDVAHAQQHDVARVHFRREAAQPREVPVAHPQQVGQRHAVHVARRRGLGRVHVGVRVDPERRELDLDHGPLAVLRTAARVVGAEQVRAARDGPQLGAVAIKAALERATKIWPQNPEVKAFADQVVVRWSRSEREP